MTKFFGHRGYSGKYPENTLLAFQKAIEAGVAGIELDVQFSKDGKMVVIHDETLERTTNGSGYVKDLTLQELKALDASASFKGQYGTVQIPTFEEVMQLVKDYDIITNVELKTGKFEYPGIEEAVRDCIRKYDLAEKVIISSFNHFSVMRMREAAPELKCGFLFEAWVIDAGKYCHSHGIPCFHPNYRNLLPSVVAEAKQYGLEINTYTVNTLEDFKQLEALGVDVAIGNFPDRIIGK